MTEQRPHIIVIGGPNGAGKSTTAPALLKGTLGVTEFVNADTIAQGLSAFNPEGMAFNAGRIYSNTEPSGPKLIVSGGKKIERRVYRPDIWNIIREEKHE